ETVAAIVENRHGPFGANSRAGGPTPSVVSTRPTSAECHTMSLRGEPLEEEATLPDGRVVLVRVGLAEDSYIPRRELDTVVLELWDEQRGEHVAGVSTVLSAEDGDAARTLIRDVVAGLESGKLEPTAGALEPLADSVL